MISAETALAQRERVHQFQQKHRLGLVTLLFTDVVGSTKLKQVLGETVAVAMIYRHHSEIRGILSTFTEAEEVGFSGDSFFIVFTKPSEAVKFALLVQARIRELARETGRPVLDRIGIHVGEVWMETQVDPTTARDFYGIQIDTCSRVQSLGTADQILMTRFVFDSARQVLTGAELEGVANLLWLNHGSYLLKGIADPVEICEVGEKDKATLTSPTNTEKGRRFVSPESEPVLGWRPAVDQLVPGTNWVLEKKLGEGGIGEVWLGRDKILKTLHVFKFCFRADRVRSLKREVTLFRLLRERIGDHPNIVCLENVFFDEAPYYIVMEHVEGQDLHAWCDARGGIDRIELPLRLEIVPQPPDALQAAHDAGIIHRDVKPSNILVSNAVEGVHVHLTDFGIGQVVSGEALAGVTQFGFTQTVLEAGARTGTHLYMAPELFAGGTSSIRSDIYSLGVVLYQLVVGNFAAPVTVDWEKHLTDLVLREDLRLCFAGNPEDRFSSAKEFAQRLRSIELRRRESAEREALIKAKERAAYRRGILRTALAGASLIAAITLLAFYALRERRDAERSARQARENLSRSDFRESLRAVNEGRTHDALAQLARSLTLDPANDAALFRLETLLMYHDFPLPGSVVRPNGAIRSAQFSENGQRIVTSSDKAVELWDSTTGHLAKTLVLRREQFETTEFILDKKLVATIRTARQNPGGSSAVQIWDADIGQEVGQAISCPFEVYRAALTVNGKRLATSSVGNVVTIWDTETRRPLAPPMQQQGYVDVMEFDARGDQLLVASSVADDPETGRDQTQVSVFDARAGQLRLGPLLAAKPVHLNPAGDRIVVGGNGGAARLLDAQTGKSISPPLQGEIYPLRAAAFSPDEKELLTLSGDAYLWDSKTGKRLAGPIKGPRLRSGSGALEDAEFSSDGKYIVATSRDGFAQIHDTGTGLQVREPIVHQGMRAAHFSSDGTKLLTVADGADACVWDVRAGCALPEALYYDTDFRCAQVSADWKRVAAGSADGTVHVWTLDAEQHLISTMTHSGPVHSIQFSSDGTKIVTASGDKTAQVWDVSSGKRIGEPLRHSWAVTFAQFSPDGRRVVTVSSDQTAQIWDAFTGKPIGKPMAHGTSAKSADFTRDGKRILTTDQNGVARIWNTESSELLKTLIRDESTLLLAKFSPDEARVVTCSGEQTARIWDAQSGRAVTEPMRHDSTVSDADFSRDGRWLVTASADNTARIWDAHTGQPVSDPFKHNDEVLLARFSPDTTRLLTATSDGTVWTWSLAPTGKPPTWLPELASAVAGQRLSEKGLPEPLKQSAVQMLGGVKADVKRAGANDEWADWTRWFLSDRGTRTIAPASTITIVEKASKVRPQTNARQDTLQRFHRNVAQPASLVPHKVDGGVLFQCYAPEARVIYLAGDFNNWGNNRNGYIDDQLYAMTGPAANGIWHKTVRLSAGEHHFKFNFDGDRQCWFRPEGIAESDVDGNAVIWVNEDGEVVIRTNQ